MVKFVTGKFGRDAIKQFSRDIHYKRIHGYLDITPEMEKQIIERTKKVFVKNGKAPLKIKERDIEKEILNPLRVRHDDKFSPDNVDSVDKGFGFTDHTKQIGSKYLNVLNLERKMKLRERLNASKIDAGPEKELKKPTEPKTLSSTPRYDELRKKIAAKERRNEIVFGRLPQKEQELGGVSRNQYAEKDKNIAGAKPGERETPNSEPRREIPRPGFKAQGEVSVHHTETAGSFKRV